MTNTIGVHKSLKESGVILTPRPGDCNFDVFYSANHSVEKINDISIKSGNIFRCRQDIGG